jgi:hypothetical protein
VKGKCPFGNLDEHFTSIEGARAHYEKLQEKAIRITGTNIGEEMVLDIPERNLQLAKDSIAAANRRLEKAGVDMLHVSGGTTIKRGSSIPAPGTKMGSHSALSAEIKKHVSIPVATVGRITEPWLAEELLENDKADICMIGRANLCEPEFCNKAQAGHEEDIRPCIGCLRCLNGIMFGKRVACTVNPSLEPENEDTITPAKETKNVALVINRDAVIKRFNMDVVFTIANDKAVMIPVKVITYFGLNAAIMGEGLAEGMPLVTKGNERVFPDMNVQVLNNSQSK